MSFLLHLLGVVCAIVGVTIYLALVIAFGVSVGLDAFFKAQKRNKEKFDD